MNSNQNLDLNPLRPGHNTTPQRVWFAVAAALACMGSAATAYGFPLTGRFPSLRTWSDAAPELLSDAYDFEGIIALGNCSGSLVRFVDSDPSDAAVVLTNGHCVDMLDPGEVRVDQKEKRTFQILSPEGRKLGAVTSNRLIYATMTGTDLGLYELAKTYADLERDFSVAPLTLANEAPQSGTAIEVISGYWRRGYSCAVDRIVHQLREGPWLMTQSIKYTDPGCEVIGGTSGSPIIEAGSRTVIGVNNTGNESGKACTVNNPCEVDSNGQVTYRKGWSYGQQTHWVYSCRDNVTGELNLQKNGCLLAAP